jgi:hypothetical protein
MRARGTGAMLSEAGTVALLGRWIPVTPWRCVSGVLLLSHVWLRDSASRCSLPHAEGREGR